MPREINAAALAQAVADQAIRTHFVQLEFEAGTVRWTTAPVDLTWGGFTWQAIGGALGIGEVTETNELVSGGTSLTIGGVTSSIIATILTNNARGRAITAWLVFLNPTTMAVVPDPLIVAKGFMNAAFTIDEDRPTSTGDAGTVKVGTRVIPRMIQTARIRPFACDELSHNRIVGHDTFFRTLGALTGKTILWGRATASPANGITASSGVGVSRVPGMGYSGGQASGGSASGGQA